MFWICSLFIGSSQMNYFPGYAWGMLVSEICVLWRISVISEYTLVFLEILGGEIFKKKITIQTCDVMAEYHFILFIGSPLVLKFFQLPLLLHSMGKLQFLLNISLLYQELLFEICSELAYPCSGTQENSYLEINDLFLRWMISHFVFNQSAPSTVTSSISFNVIQSFNNLENWALLFPSYVSGARAYRG